MCLEFKSGFEFIRVLCRMGSRYHQTLVPKLNAYGVWVLVKGFPHARHESIAPLSFNLRTGWTQVTSITLPSLYPCEQRSRYPLNSSVVKPVWTLRLRGKPLLMPGVKPARSKVTLTTTLSRLPANSLHYMAARCVYINISHHFT
jgi:hypothetical protein